MSSALLKQILLYAFVDHLAPECVPGQQAVRDARGILP
jgi:hypothetical protein